MAVVESTKAASDVYAPLAGAVIAVNPALTAEPELVNTDPYGAGWLVRLQPADAASLTGSARRSGLYRSARRNE